MTGADLQSTDAPIGYVLREASHSRGDGGADRLIMRAVLDRLEGAGRAVERVDAKRLRRGSLAEFPTLLSMARTRENLSRIATFAQGCRVINAPLATLDTLRERMYPRLEAAGVPMPSTCRIDLRQPLGELAFPLWLKRVDYHHIVPDDVCRVDGVDELDAARSRYLRQGQREVFAQAHLEGEHVKVYGVFDAAASRITFFEARHPRQRTELDQLSAIALDALRHIPLEIFGADFIIAHDGPQLVDLNPWPSFRTCRDTGADAIANLVLEQTSSESPAT